MNTGFIIREATWDKDEPHLTQVRAAVFIQEQQVPACLDLDGRDPDCRHVLALDRNGRPVGAGRILPGGRIGRMAVLNGYRGRGIGRRMLELLIATARRMGLEQVTLGAQIAVIGFYERLGFVAHGEVFMDAGIPHRMMSRHIVRGKPSAKV